MKDLYSKMSLEPEAGEEEIAAAIQQRPEWSAYSTILLNRDRRAFYDRTHATLRTIGELRHRLKLEAGGSWFLDTSPDFAHRFNPALAPAPPKPAASDTAPGTARADTPPAADTRSEKPVTRKHVVAIAIGVISLILLILAVSYF